jgi:CBS domain containing-hemolysin-like protein
MHSSYSRLPLIRDGAVDEPLGFVHKKELLKEYLAGNEPTSHLARQTINLLDSYSILNALEQMRRHRPTSLLWSTSSVISSAC